ncbi:BAR domain protein [Actinidia chinensis var. chinensis]|uniref:BAR domain protein n=1 Tax=Actinidia chinensis var. chinensis TaxID=1590841 RepID=A0A2R6REJ8_ACTCC|nr:BAR domain protein [Actinidia chinensis var. chinensis]
MKTSLRKLGGFARKGHGEVRERRDRHRQQSMAQLEEIARASQDMQDMKDCYDSLLSAAAATANSAYEFSESLREMGACLLEKTALNDDEESGKVLLMLGKVQFELQKLVDNYRSHIFQTITSPSESLLNELRIVEGMKKQCDEKRSLYEYMITRRREKGRLKSSKGESFSSQQLQDARDEYDEEATLFVFRLKSLKQGQSRSFLTQAARHHAAQLCFFRKALKSLETVEPHVKLVTKQQHIDYQFRGIEDDDGDNDDSYDDDSDDDDGSYSEHDDGELSFDYGQNDQVKNVVSTLRDSMELDRVDVTFPQVAMVDAAKGNLERNHGGDYFAIGKELKTTSQSAPLSAEKKFDPAERFRQMRPLSTRKSNSYVLPTPVEPKSPVAGPDPVVSGTRQARLSGTALNYRHSSPLEQKRNEKILQNEKLSEPIVLSQPSVRRESNSNTTSACLPLPLTEDLSSRQHDRHTTSDNKKIKRRAFSGPLTSKEWSNKPGLSASSPIVSTVLPKLFSGPLLRTPMPPPSSPKLSTSASPTYVSSPKIRELHELPRPPTNLASKYVGRPSNQIGYSGPLLSKDQETIPAANKLATDVASPLPKPHLTISRSFSIPSMGQKGTLITCVDAVRTTTDFEDN